MLSCCIPPKVWQAILLESWDWNCSVGSPHRGAWFFVFEFSGQKCFIASECVKSRCTVLGFMDSWLVFCNLNISDTWITCIMALSFKILGWKGWRMSKPISHALDSKHNLRCATNARLSHCPKTGEQSTVRLGRSWLKACICNNYVCHFVWNIFLRAVLSPI